MHLLAAYWWLLVLPVAFGLWVYSIRRTPRSTWIWLLRIIGAVLIIGTSIWLVTGDIDTPYLELHVGGGRLGALLWILLGLGALVFAQRLAARSPPPA